MCESPKCYTEKYPKARKEHLCCECRGKIKVGEKYQLYKGIWDDPMTFKTCIDCSELRSRFVASGDVEWEFKAFYEFLSDWSDKDFALAFNIFKKRRKEIPEWMVKKALGVGDWVFERSSGYAGWRCSFCRTWVYENDSKKCKCRPIE